MKKKYIVLFFLIAVLFYVSLSSSSNYKMTPADKNGHPVCPVNMIPLSSTKWNPPKNQYVNTTDCGDGSFKMTKSIFDFGYKAYYTSNTASPQILYYSDSSPSTPVKPEDLLQYAS